MEERKGRMKKNRDIEGERKRVGRKGREDVGVRMEERVKRMREKGKKSE